jgi:hemoglobin
VVKAKHEEADVEPQPTSLYERLGGIYSIATVVDDFIDRIMVDDRLNANPRVNEAHHRVSPPGFKYLVTEQLGEASGGPQRYTGRSMEESHPDLLITAVEWDAFIDDLNQTLDKFEVPQQERSEVTRHHREHKRRHRCRTGVLNQTQPTVEGSKKARWPIQSDRRSLLKQTRQQPSARKASWISARRS